jgi:hypothetical protein
MTFVDVILEHQKQKRRWNRGCCWYLGERANEVRTVWARACICLAIFNGRFELYELRSGTFLLTKAHQRHVESFSDLRVSLPDQDLTMTDSDTEVLYRTPVPMYW